MKLATLFWLCMATASAAQVMDGQAFDAFSRGKTLYFTNKNVFYGAEHFFSDHRTVWRAGDGSCVNGTWAYSAPNICFTYDNKSGPFCWQVETTPSGTTVTSQIPKDTPPLVLTVSGQDRTPIQCQAPAFGVVFRP